MRPWRSTGQLPARWMLRKVPGTVAHAGHHRVDEVAAAGGAARGTPAGAILRAAAVSAEG